MKRFGFKVTSAGTQMDDSPLYNLVVIDAIAEPRSRYTEFNELTASELAYYRSQFNE